MNISAKNRQLAINIVAQIIAFAVNAGINFFVTPFIVNQLGRAAYGFIGLANNFVGYASLITIALNSMAGRFMTIAIHRGDTEKANGYFNSLLFSNVILTIVMVIPSSLCVVYIDKLVNVPDKLLLDVRLTFAVVFLNFLFSTIQTSFSMVFFVRNKLYLNSMRSIESNFIRIAVIVALFFIFSPRIVYMVLGTLVSTIFVLITNIYYTKKLLPELAISSAAAKIKYLKELVESGIWNCLTKLSQVFTSGLDLLVSNLFLGAAAMGTLSLAKMLPNFIVSFITSVSGVFSPNLTILYAKNQMNELIAETKSAMKVMSIFSAIPNALIVVFGFYFFRLWVPGEDARQLQILSVLTVANSCITGPIHPLYQLFTITNKIKLSSVAMIAYGVITFFITLIMLKFTSFGLYAIAGVSLVTSVLVALLFHIPVSAKIIGMKKQTFYPEVFKSCFAFGIVVLIGSGYKILYTPTNWFGLLFSMIVVGTLGLLLNFLLILSKRERNLLMMAVRGKLHK